MAINIFGRRGKTGSKKNLVFDFFPWKSGNQKNLEGSEGVFSAVTRLSNMLAGTPFRLCQNGRIKNDHVLSKLFGYETAPGITPFLYKHTMETCRNIYGNAYALKIPGLDGRIERLDILNPERVEPMVEEETGEIYYRISTSNGRILLVHYKEMIHVKHVSTTGRKGVSPVKVLANALDYDEQMRTFSMNALRGINTCVTLKFMGNLGKTREEEVVKNFMDVYNKSMGNLLVLSGGTEADVIAKSPVDSKVLDIEKITKGRIAAVYSLPPHMLGNFEHAGYQNNEQQMLELVQTTMSSTFRQYEEEHNLKLLTWEEIKNGLGWRFAEEEMITPTRLERAQEAQYLIRSGIKTPNELRTKYGDEQLKGGDNLFVSRDLVPAAYLANNPDGARRYG